MGLHLFSRFALGRWCEPIWQSHSDKAMSWPTSARGSKKQVPKFELRDPQCRLASQILAELPRDFSAGPGFMNALVISAEETHTTADNCSKQRDGADTSTALMSSGCFQPLPVVLMLSERGAVDLRAGKAGSRCRPPLRKISKNSTGPLQCAEVRERPLPRSDVPSPKGTVLISRATPLECEAGRGGRDPDPANAVSLARARSRADTSRDRLLWSDPLPSPRPLVRVRPASADVRERLLASPKATV